VTGRRIALADSSIILQISHPNDEALDHECRSLGVTQRRRQLNNSGADNWKDIGDQIAFFRSTSNLIGCMFLLSIETLERFISAPFISAAEHLISQVSGTRAIAFIYQDLLDDLMGDLPYEMSQDVYGIRERFKSEQCSFPAGSLVRKRIAEVDLKDFHPRENGELPTNFNVQMGVGWFSASRSVFWHLLPKIEEILNERNRDLLALLNRLSDAGIEIVPYRTRQERLTRSIDFMREAASGGHLRLYVPHGRFQSDQLGPFVRLIERYLSQIENVPLSVVTQTTLHGTVYTFQNLGGSLTSLDLRGAIERLETLLELYNRDPDQASHLLVAMGIAGNAARPLLEKYARDFRRLTLDLKHEAETKTLMLRQRLEAEAIELSTQVSPVEANMKLNYQAASVLLGPLDLGSITASGYGQMAESLLAGDIRYSKLDRELLELFRSVELGGDTVNLTSSLDLLKDNSAPQDIRTVAKQKMVSFLYRSIHKLGHSVVMEYVEYLSGLEAGI
jgi:hypothetical protein